MVYAEALREAHARWSVVLSADASLAAHWTQARELLLGGEDHSAQARELIITLDFFDGVCSLLRHDDGGRLRLELKWADRDAQRISDALLGIAAVAPEGHVLRRLHDSGELFTVFRFRFDVTVFTQDDEWLLPAMEKVQKLGYRWSGRFNPSPNDDWNIKWGAAPTRLVEELVDLFAGCVGKDPDIFNRRHVFGANDTDIYINVRHPGPSGSGT